MPELVILEGEQLQQLAKMIHIQEMEAIQNIKFTSEVELAKYLTVCRENWDFVIKLLDDGKKTKEKFETDEKRSTIALDIYSYLVLSINVALQTVRNYTLRSNYITKISEHAKDIIKALEELDPNNLINVQRLAKEAVQYRNCMLEYTRKYQSAASRSFSKWLKESGIKFENLVQRYQTKRELPGQFKDLNDEEKLLVYNDIIEASGRGNLVVNNISKMSGVAGIAVLIFIAATMVWDIFSSEHIFQQAIRDAIETAASLGGAMIGEVVGAALPSLIGIEASASFVMVAGIAGSIAGAFIIGAFVGWLFDLIFGSGDSVPFSTDGHRCYVTPLPDGEILARQIANGDQPTA